MTATVPHTRPLQYCSSRRQHVTDQDCLDCFTAGTPDAVTRRRRFRLRGDCVDTHIEATALMLRPVAVIERREDDDCMVVLECGHFALTNSGDQAIPCRHCLREPRPHSIDERAGEAIADACRRHLAAMRKHRRQEISQ